MLYHSNFDGFTISVMCNRIAEQIHIILYGYSIVLKFHWWCHRSLGDLLCHLTICSLSVYTIQMSLSCCWTVNVMVVNLSIADSEVEGYIPDVDIITMWGCLWYHLQFSHSVNRKYDMWDQCHKQNGRQKSALIIPAFLFLHNRSNARKNG